MRKKRLVLVGIVLLALFFVVKRKIELMRAPVFGKRPILVSVFYSRKGEIERFAEYLAEVRPVRTAKISTKIPAEVQEVYVDEGSVVKKGDVLAELDKREILARLNSAKGSLSSAKENFEYWKKEYERDETLFQAGAISEEERDRAKNNFARAQANLKTAEENVNFWQAELDYVEVKSPYDGVISRRFVDPGTLATVGKPLFELEDRSVLKLVFDVPQADLSFIKKGGYLLYRSGGKWRSAKITNIFPSLNLGKTLRIESYVKPDGSLYVGEFVPVKVLVARKSDVVIIPKSAVCMGANSHPFVFVVKGNRLKRYPIVLGITSGRFVEVRNLKVGMPVVENPYLSWTKLSEGQAVKVLGGDKR